MKLFARNGQHLKDIVFSSRNLILQRIHIANPSKGTIILGTGYSLTLTDKSVIKKHDPAMTFPTYVPKLLKNYTVYIQYFPDSCDGLLSAGKELANYANRVFQNKNLILIGHSKCGVCYTNAFKWFQKKPFLITVSAPYKGTIVANKSAIDSKLTGLSNILANEFHSDHAIDRDIIFKSKFLRKLTLPESNHINIVSELNGWKDISCFPDIFPYIVGKVLHIENSDGIVTKQSQELKRVLNIYITASHASSLRKTLEMIDELLPSEQKTAT